MRKELEVRIAVDAPIMRVQQGLSQIFPESDLISEKYVPISLLPVMTESIDEAADLQIKSSGHSDLLHMRRLKQCRSCPTEFKIEVEDSGGLKIAVLVTVWRNFGTGTTPGPEMESTGLQPSR